MKAPEGSDDDDDDFEEVPEKEGFEPHIPDHLREEYGEFAQLQRTRGRYIHNRVTAIQTASEKSIMKSNPSKLSPSPQDITTHTSHAIDWICSDKHEEGAKECL